MTVKENRIKETGETGGRGDGGKTKGRMLADRKIDGVVKGKESVENETGEKRKVEQAATEKRVEYERKRQEKKNEQKGGREEMRWNIQDVKMEEER